MDCPFGRMVHIFDLSGYDRFFMRTCRFWFAAAEDEEPSCIGQLSSLQIWAESVIPATLLGFVQRNQIEVKLENICAGRLASCARHDEDYPHERAQKFCQLHLPDLTHSSTQCWQILHQPFHTILMYAALWQFIPS